MVGGGVEVGVEMAAGGRNVGERVGEGSVVGGGVEVGVGMTAGGRNVGERVGEGSMVGPEDLAVNVAEAEGLAAALSSGWAIDSDSTVHPNTEKTPARRSGSRKTIFIVAQCRPNVAFIA